MAESVFETDGADVIFLSLKPELETPVTDRSSIMLEPCGSQLTLKIVSDDLVSMRSTLNTWLRLIQVAHEVYNCSMDARQDG
ncbi:KEOPS complex subunit Pcc1 [Methanolobus sp. ZRKC3]|uniref:KEOPS complex subunit Pcc1 n=1 Tax=Methanolobus sp. ZRKC3 TaxID=3125786 RepID=UPI00324F01A2